MANGVTANNCHHHKYRVGLFWSLWLDWKILAQPKHSHSSVWKGSMTPYIQPPCLSWTLQNMTGPSCSTIDDSHPLKVTHCCTIFSAEKWATWKGLWGHVRPYTSTRPWYTTPAQTKHNVKIPCPLQILPCPLYLFPLDCHFCTRITLLIAENKTHCKFWNHILKRKYNTMTA